ncbi:immunoglobulin lambda-1 light chain-like [Cetorhinus maximus]
MNVHQPVLCSAESTLDDKASSVCGLTLSQMQAVLCMKRLNCKNRKTTESFWIEHHLPFQAKSERHSVCTFHTSFTPRDRGRVRNEIRIGGSESDRLKSRTMSFLGVCALSHLFQVIVSQPVLSQSPPVQTLPAGSRAELSCHTESPLVDYAFWYRQWWRNDMKLVYTAGKYLPAEGRFSSESSDKAGNYSLLIADTRRNDSGMYYCAIRNYQNRVLIIGNGSKLVITEGPPTIFLLTPPEDEIHSMERVPLLCLIRGSSPDSFPVRWNVSGRVTEAQTDPGTIETDGTYTIRSYTSLSAETWSSGALCTCAVQINSSENLLSASVSSQGGSY